MPVKFIPGQGFVEVDASGNPSTAAPNLLGGGSQVPSKLWDSTSGPDFVRGMGKAAGNALELGAGFLAPENMLAKLALAAVTGGAAGLMNGEGATKEAGSNMLLEGVGNGMSKFAPDAGNWLALKTGGMFKPKGGVGVGDAIDAFGRINEEMAPGRRIPVGRPSRVADVAKETNGVLEAAEKADPSIVDLRGFKGATQDLKDKAINATTPVSDRLNLSKQEMQFLREQLRARGTTDLSMRDLGEIKRNHMNAAGDVIAARKGGQYIPTSEKQAGKVKEAIGGRARELQLDAERSMSLQGEPGPIELANNKLSDLKKMKAANDSMRYAGVVPALGQMVVRGGLGAAGGTTLAALAGTDKSTSAAIGGLLGLFGLAPVNLSREGLAAGRVGQVLPSGVRLGEAMSGADEAMAAKKQVKLKEPKQ